RSGGDGGAARADAAADRGDLRPARGRPDDHPARARAVPRRHRRCPRLLAAGAPRVLRPDHRCGRCRPRPARGGLSMSTRPDPVLTEEDLAALDTSEGHGEDARPEEKVNALAARLGAVIALIA